MGEGVQHAGLADGRIADDGQFQRSSHGLDPVGDRLATETGSFFFC